jgi:hypothetical protein
MRSLNVAFTTVVVLLAAACGQGTAPASLAARGGNSTIGLFLSRSSSMTSKDGDDLAKACAADVKKFCASVKSGEGYARRLAHCLGDHHHDLSVGCRAGIEKMRHDKHDDDACAGACACTQSCVADDEDDDGDKDKDKGKDGGSSSDDGKSHGKGSLRVAVGATTSHEASHDEDHDDDDLRCVGPCPKGMASCDGRCVDVSSDPENCGRCDNECSEHGQEVCSAGKCKAKCAASLTNCEDACVDTGTDANNCGVCGLACGCDQVCQGGKCVAAAACPPGQNLCAGACVAATDPTACGAACTVCQTDPNGVAVCAAGVCSLVCIPPAILVNGMCNVPALRTNLPPPN